MMIPSKAQTPSSHARSLDEGVRFGLAAYLCWGFFPVYFKALVGVPALEVLAHRVVWSGAFALSVVFIAGKSKALLSVLRDPGARLTLFCSALLVSTNWLVFIYAVTTDHVLESSLGYFMNPLVSVLLGFLFLRERFRPLQKISVALAGAGVLTLVLSHGQIPWISLVLAISFAFYGLLRKTVRADSLVGLTVETAYLCPVALGYILMLGVQGQGHFLAGSTERSLLLPVSGVVTALPLLLFAAAARRLRLATIGFLQYITPTLHLLLAVWVYREPFLLVHFVTFTCIWTGLIIYSVDASRSPAAPMTIRAEERPLRRRSS